jgi:hypothetical protein
MKPTMTLSLINAITIALVMMEQLICWTQPKTLYSKLTALIINGFCRTILVVIAAATK